MDYLKLEKMKEEYCALDTGFEGKPLRFEITEVKSQDPSLFYWTAKVKFPGRIFKKFFPNYTLHFILSTEKHARNLEVAFERMHSKQTDMFSEDFSPEEYKKKVNADYAELAEGFGNKTFSARLKEYKADENANTDCITFVLKNSDTEWLIKNGSRLSDMQLIINELSI